MYLYGAHHHGLSPSQWLSSISYEDNSSRCPRGFVILSCLNSWQVQKVYSPFTDGAQPLESHLPKIRKEDCGGHSTEFRVLKATPQQLDRSSSYSKLDLFGQNVVPSEDADLSKLANKNVSMH